MTLMLPPSPSKGMYGFKPNVTSWGGQALRSNVDNKYHLFVSEIPGGLRASSSSSSASNGFMEHSKSPFGPWTPSATAPEHCNNPAPAYHPNGTLFIICNNFDLVSAPYGWNAEWTKPTSIGKPPPSTDTDRQVAGIMLISLFCCWCH